MKLFALFTVSALARRPDEIDVVNRLSELRRMATDCAPQLVLERNGKQGARAHITNKLARMDKMAVKYCKLQHEECAEAYGDAKTTDAIRINEERPCNCVRGVTGGYKSFFNRAKVNASHKKGKKKLFS